MASSLFASIFWPAVTTSAHVPTFSPAASVFACILQRRRRHSSADAVIQGKALLYPSVLNSTYTFSMTVSRSDCAFTACLLSSFCEHGGSTARVERVSSTSSSKSSAHHSRVDSTASSSSFPFCMLSGLVASKESLILPFDGLLPLRMCSSDLFTASRSRMSASPRKGLRPCWFECEFAANRITAPFPFL